MSELHQMKPLTTEDGGFYYPVSEKERYFYSKYPDTGRIFTNIVEWQADYETGYARAIAEVYLDTTLVSRAEAVVFARSWQNVERMSEEECSQTTYPFGGDYKNAPLPTLMSSDGGKRCLCWATGIGEKAYKGKQSHIIRASRSIILKVLGL